MQGQGWRIRKRRKDAKVFKEAPPDQVTSTGCCGCPKPALFNMQLWIPST